MDNPWRVELFGGLQAHQDTHTVSRFQTQKIALLLAFLAYHCHRPHTRERLIDLLWPDATLDQGRNRLSQALSSLRRQLEPPGLPVASVLVTTRSHVQLNPRAVVTDISVFEGALRSAARSDDEGVRITCLARAVEVYQGDLLPAFYEEWVLRERGQLHQRFMDALGQLTRALARRGDLEGALDYARRLVIEDPFREPDRLHLMSLYAASGNPAAGLRLCTEWERLLREELGETPSGEMQAMKAKLSAAAPGVGRPARPQPDTPGQPKTGQPKRGAAAAPPGRRHAPKPISLGRVPLRFTRFFGREEELPALTGLLADPAVRLVTLTGLGGIGKTRLAIETVAPLKGRVAGGVWFASLADLRDPSAILGAVRDALRLPRLPGLDPLEQVSAALAEHPALLVLDNFEHLLDGGTAAVATLLSRVPLLTCLVTSRRRLDVPGETVFPVSALPLPSLMTPGIAPPGAPASLSALADLSAVAGVQLFVDRARFVRPDFQLTPRKAGDLVRLLRTLEGIPLAIELAAAQAKALTLADMAERLTARFDLLAMSRPRIEARHLSLRATLEWSYDLLPLPLRRFFASLSVFRGGWDREAAQAVCGNVLGSDVLGSDVLGSDVLGSDVLGSDVLGSDVLGSDVLGSDVLGSDVLGSDVLGSDVLGSDVLGSDVLGSDVLGSDVLGSDVLGSDVLGSDVLGSDVLGSDVLGGDVLGGVLSVPVAIGELTSFSLLISDEGGESTHPSDKGNRADRARMLETVREFAEGCLTAAELAALRRRHAAYYLAWAEAAEPKLHGPEQPAWLDRLEDEHDNLRAALDWGTGQPEHDETGLRLAGAVFWFWHLRNHLSEGRARLEALLARPGGGANRVRADALQGAGQLAYYQHDFAQARARLGEGVALRRALGDTRGAAYGLVYAGSAAKQEGDYPAARTLLTESVALAREAGDPWVLGMALWMEAVRHRTEGDDAAALPLLKESEALLRAVGDPWALAAPTHYLADILLAQGDYAGARAQGEEVSALTRATGNLWRLAGDFNTLGEIALLEGSLDQARPLLEESLALSRAANTPERVAYALCNLGHIALVQGNRPEAYACYRESLLLYHGRSDRRGVAHTLEAFARLAGAEGQAARASCLFAAADSLGREFPGLLPLFQRRDHDQHVSAIRAALGEEAFAAAWAKGGAFTREAAVAYALEETGHRRTSAPRPRR